MSIPEDVRNLAREAAASVWNFPGDEHIAAEFRAGLRDESGSVKSSIAAIMVDREKRGEPAAWHMPGSLSVTKDRDMTDRWRLGSPEASIEPLYASALPAPAQPVDVDARIAELTEQRDTALAAMQILADRLKEVERVVTAAIAENYMMVEEGRKHETDLVKRTFYQGVAAAIDTLEIHFKRYKKPAAASDIRT